MQPVWIASTAIVLAGIGMILVGHFDGAYNAFIIFGAVVLALGITVSAVGGGLTNPWALIFIFSFLTIFLIAIDFYNLFGLRGWI